MKEAVGDTQGTTQFNALAAKARKAFNTLFWDDSLGFYRDWVDINGKAHAYLYADVSFLAVTLGVADQAQATRIFTAVDGRYETLMQKYGLTRETNLWATPVNFFPVEPQVG
jgi:neutral trehalase